VTGAIWVTSLIAAAITVADQLRRPHSQWIAADRDRSYWVSCTVVAGLFACGLVAALVYAIGVLPRFARGPASDAAFSKSTGQVYEPAPARHAPESAPPPAPAPASPPALDAPETPSRGKLVIELDDV